MVGWTSTERGGVLTVSGGQLFWPSQTEWKYWDGDDWQYDPELTITGEIEINQSHTKKVFLQTASNIQITFIANRTTVSSQGQLISSLFLF